MEHVVFDTTAFIEAFRARIPYPEIARREGQVRPYLSAVVAHELYVGATSDAIREQLDDLWEIYRQLGRVVTPSRQEWREAGLLLARVSQSYGSGRVGSARLTNDALIALSAGRRNLTVITGNEADFALLGQFVRFRFRRPRTT